MKNKNPRNIEDHHIVPVSKRGKTTSSNIAKLPQGEHQDYHNLFGNRTPVEVLQYLCDHLWLNQEGYNGNCYIRDYIKRFM
jgi:hypothetical protein